MQGQKDCKWMESTANQKLL